LVAKHQPQVRFFRHDEQLVACEQLYWGGQSLLYQAQLRDVHPVEPIVEFPIMHVFDDEHQPQLVTVHVEQFVYAEHGQLSHNQDEAAHP
jgi:hypothetical protein